MDDDIDFARLLASGIVSQLGEQGPDWEIGSVEHQEDDFSGTGDFSWSPTVRVEFRSISGEYESVGVYFVYNGVSLGDSVIATADGIQDHAVEMIPGAALPPCPGHHHPAVARVVDDVPKWVCMKDGAAHFSEDIVPGLQPGMTLAEYMRRHRVRTS
ncbi:hypothetical protein [Pseudonocardia spinosispora]|uniref:hypothetical protein n=1 Tax=Pseudonocardia spinosispora TaxID=103441 RepID=UPI00048A726B|nr:hypothetical protein [Pseudonocardia spinosispora]